MGIGCSMGKSVEQGKKSIGMMKCRNRLCNSSPLKTHGPQLDNDLTNVPGCPSL